MVNPKNSSPYRGRDSGRKIRLFRPENEALADHANSLLFFLSIFFGGVRTCPVHGSRIGQY